MIKTLVVPLDGSDLASEALPVARDLAGRLGAAVHLVTTTWSEPGGDEQAALDRAAASLADGGLEVTTEVRAHEFPGEGIVEAARDAPDAAVCLRSHGRGGWSEAVLGSVAENVVRLGEQPVIVVGPECRASLGDGGAVLVGYDGSTAGAALEPLAVALARLLGAPIVVVAVELHDALLSAGSPTDLGERAAQVVDRMGRDGVTARLELLAGVDPADALTDLARNLPASLIVLASHGGPGTVRSALGHVASRAVRHSPCPVVIQRPAGG